MSTPSDQVRRGDFFTPPQTARFMARSLQVGAGDRVLEPSGGDGALIAALLDEGVEPGQITTWEIDAAATRNLTARFPGIQVECRDVLLGTDPAKESGFTRIIANPPYLNKQSAYVRENREALRARYGARVGSGETYAMFLALALELLAPGGRLCFLVSDTIRTLRTHERLRRLVLEHHRLERLAANPSRLFRDASVRTCILVASKHDPADQIRTLPIADDEASYEDPSLWGRVSRADLMRLPGSPWAMSAPAEVVDLLADSPGIGEVAGAHIGMHTRDNARSLAALDSTPSAEIFRRRRQREGDDPQLWRVISAVEALNLSRWRPYLRARGLRDFSAAIEEYLDWEPGRRASYVIPSGPLFGREGLVISGVCGRLSARLMPAGCLWDTNKAIGMVPHEGVDRLWLLGLLCSDLYSYMAKAILNDSASLQLSDLMRLPAPRVNEPEIAEAVSACFESAGRGVVADAARERLNHVVYRALGVGPDAQSEIAEWLFRRRLPQWTTASVPSLQTA